MLVASDVPIPVGYSICLTLPHYNGSQPSRCRTAARVPWLNWTSRYSTLLCGCPGRFDFLRVDVYRLAEPCTNLLVVLAKRRRRELVARRRQRERDRMTNHWHGIIPGANLD